MPTDPADLGPPARLLNSEVLQRPFQNVIFDFDGTLSLITEGWIDVMATLMVETLTSCAAEPPEGWRQVALELIIPRIGRPSLHQMEALVQAINKFGGSPLSSIGYLDEYHRRLFKRTNRRKEALANKEVLPCRLLVPGAMELLSDLTARGATLWLLSGTEVGRVKEEASLLGLTPFFTNRIFGPMSSSAPFTKRDVMLRIMHESGTHDFLNFGDGVVETICTKEFGATAVGVATLESSPGDWEDWKVARLSASGADILVADLRRGREVVAWLWRERNAFPGTEGDLSS